MKEMENGGNDPAGRYGFEVIGKKKPGMGKKLLFQLIRFLLAAVAASLNAYRKDQTDTVLASNDPRD